MFLRRIPGFFNVFLTKILKSASVPSQTRSSPCVLPPAPSPPPLLHFLLSCPTSSDDLRVSTSVLHLPSSPPPTLIHACSTPTPRLVSRRRRRERDRSLRLVAEEGAGHHLFVFTSPPPGRRRREEGMKKSDGGAEMSFCESSHIDTSYSRVSC